MSFLYSQTGSKLCKTLEDKKWAEKWAEKEGTMAFSINSKNDRQQGTERENKGKIINHFHN